MAIPQPAKNWAANGAAFLQFHQLTPAVPGCILSGIKRH